MATRPFEASYRLDLENRRKFLAQVHAHQQEATRTIGGVYHQTMLRIEQDYLKAEKAAVGMGLGTEGIFNDTLPGRISVAAGGMDVPERLGAGVPGFVSRMAAVQPRAAFITQQMQLLAMEVQDVTMAAAPHAWALGQSFAKANIQGTRVVFGTPNAKQVEQAAARFAHNGTAQVEWVDRYARNATNSITQRITTGVMLGEHPQKIARAIRDEMTAPRALLDTFARTELMGSARAGLGETLRDNSDVVEGWIWSATEGPGTCECCWAMDGQQFTLEEELDSHPNCECIQEPITQSAEQIIAQGLAEGESAVTEPNSFMERTPSVDQEDLNWVTSGADAEQRAQAMDALQAVHGNPGAEVSTYRVVRENVKAQEALSRNDVVMLSRKQAEAKAAEWRQGDVAWGHTPDEAGYGAPKILETKIKARDLRLHPDDFTQAYYTPPISTKERLARLDRELKQHPVAPTSAQAFDSQDRFLAMSEEDQIKVLGPTKHALLKSGKITLRDLVQKTYSDTWGPGIRPTTLKELGRAGVVLPEKSERITVKMAKAKVEAELAALDPWLQELKAAEAKVDMDEWARSATPEWLGRNAEGLMVDPSTAQRHMDALLEYGKVLDREAARRMAGEEGQALERQLQDALDRAKALDEIAYTAHAEAERMLSAACDPYDARISDLWKDWSEKELDIHTTWQETNRLEDEVKRAIAVIRKEMKADAEWARWNSEVERLQKALAKTRAGREKARHAYRMKEATVYRDVLRDAGVDFGGTYVVDGTSGAEQWLRDMEGFHPARWKDASNAFTDYPMKLKLSKGRGYYSHGKWLQGRQVGLVVSDKPVTMLHEITHRAEYLNVRLHRMESLFYQYRTRPLGMAGAQERKQSLSDIYKGYGYKRSEITRPDDFAYENSGQYAGKDYGGRTYELTTMGWANGLVGREFPMDEDYRAFILAVLGLG